MATTMRGIQAGNMDEYIEGFQAFQFGTGRAPFLIRFRRNH